MRTFYAGIAITALAVTAILLASNAAAQRELSGSELLRAERCAGLYDCDEDGSWAAGDPGRPPLAAAEGQVVNGVAPRHTARRELITDADRPSMSDRSRSK